MITDIAGWIGAFLLATCGFPQLLKSIRSTKTTIGLSLSFLYLWLTGEILVLWYAIFRAPKWPLILNYSFNIVIILGILGIYHIYGNGRDRNLFSETIMSPKMFLGDEISHLVMAGSIFIHSHVG